MDNLGRSRGLGGASPRRLYVIAIDAGSNTVAAGPDEALRGKSLLVSGMTLVSGGKLERPVRARIDFDRPRRAITPGQAVGNTVLGGAMIEKTL